jgi:CRP/FNR family transcriptional regulator, cyclic AMP receptor protein
VRWGVFSSSDTRTLERVAASSVVRSFAPHETVFRQGEIGHSCYVVQSGRFEAEVSTVDGNVMQLRIHGPEEHFGELALLDPRLRRTATVTALEPSAALVLSPESFAELRGSKAVEAALAARLVELVVMLTAESTDNAYLSAERRLAKRLVSLAAIYAGPGARQDDPVTIPLSQEHLGAAIGATRPTINRMLGALEAGGLVRRSRSKIIILNRAALARRDLS